MGERAVHCADLEVEGVSRRFGSVTALDGVSVRAAPGEVICLAGQSGCGKSTLLRVIAGIERPDQGRVLLAGREVSAPRAHVEPEDRNIGFMFQDYALFPHLNVRDNIMFGLKRLARREALVRCDQITQRLGLGPLAARFPHMLSGGEQQRVALARALAPQPGILLMDEPFSNLDRGLRDGIRGETISLLRELGTTVIMVTHDPEEALSTGDRLVLMRAGRVVQTGTGAQLYDRPASVYAAEFFSKFNKIEGECRGGAVNTPLGLFAAPDCAEGRASVYIRPHGLWLNSAEGVDCTVIDAMLMGEIEQTTLAVPGLAQPVSVRSTERHGLRSGDRTRVTVRADGVFVFPTRMASEV